MTLNERGRVNLVSLLASVGILFVAFEVSSGSFATRINKISQNLDRAMTDLMDQNTVNFTELSNDAIYMSETKFNPKGMTGLYNLTRDYMELIFPKDTDPQGFLRVEDNQLHLGDYQNEWQNLLATYSGLLAMIIILALIIGLFPICGLCFCCCRCCGKCGARSQPFDKKHDLCKKIVLATLLISLGTLLLFGVVCAFVSNQQMQEGVDDLTKNVRTSIRDVDTYLDTTKGQLDTLLTVNYQEFKTHLVNTLDNSGDIVFDELANYSNATSMTELAHVLDGLPKIKNSLSTLKYSTNSLRVYASQLSDAVRKVKNDLLGILSSDDCTKITKCGEIYHNVTRLQTNIQFNNLPDITDEINQLDKFLGRDGIFSDVANGTKTLTDIKDKISTSVHETLVEAKLRIDDVDEEIAKGAKNIITVIDDLKDSIATNANSALDTADKYIIQYAPYRYYVELTISCSLLLVTILVALGLICGICGKRPDGYGDDCCNKGTGSQCLICAVIWMFIIGFIIAAVVLISFLVGVVTQRVLCDPVRDPANSKLFDLVDKANFSQYYIDFKISEALINCYDNKSLYEVFHLKNKFDLDEVKEYVNRFKIDTVLNQLDVTGVNLENLTLLDENSRKELLDFASSSFSTIDFDKFKSVLEANFTTVNLTDISEELGELIGQINNTPPNSRLTDELRVSQMNINMYQEKIVEPMVKNATDVIELAKELEQDLKFNHTSFHEAINAMLVELDQAESTLKKNGTDYLKSTVKKFGEGVINQIKSYLDRVVTKTAAEVGKCGPLGLVIKSVLTSTCDKILLPWNGYWFGLFWSVLIFVPTIIVSAMLATLYQKHSAYSREMVDARSGKFKKKNKKQKRYEDRPVPSAGGDMVSREYAAGSNHQDTRYSDMAPKQWEDFPAGGPPQYQRAPTEYERPPPYYYPGSGDTNQ